MNIMPSPQLRLVWHLQLQSEALDSPTQRSFTVYRCFLMNWHAIRRTCGTLASSMREMRSNYMRVPLESSSMHVLRQPRKPARSCIVRDFSSKSTTRRS